MSIVATRPPLEQIGMNSQKRRSARLSQENEEENEYPAKKSRANAASATVVSTKADAGDTRTAGRKRNKAYDEKVDGFTFSKGKRKTASREAKAQPPVAEKREDAVHAPPATAPAPAVAPSRPDESEPKTAQKKARRKLPTTPEQDLRDRPVRRSLRLSNENAVQEAPSKPAEPARVQTMPNRSPTPEWVQPVTVEKKRKKVGDSVEEEKTKRFVLSFADTPIIQRNKQMRKGSGDGRRRSSSGMRGKRASSLMDEGRGNALPHPEVPTDEFFKHISADLIETRRMRCLIGWCATRALPSELEPPKEDTEAARFEFEASQIARTISEQISQDLNSKGSLSDWFGRDESAPVPKPLRKKPNPRNITNAGKVEELEQELQRLKNESLEWDKVIASAAVLGSPQERRAESDGQLSPIRSELLDSPQQAIVEQFHASGAGSLAGASTVQQRLGNLTQDLEYTIDLFANGVNALDAARSTATRVADRTLADAALVFEEREKQRTSGKKPIDQMDALRGLARVLNARYRRA